MAKLTDGIHFTGSISGMSAYRMKGSDKIILRSKGGASKRKIKDSPNFESTRQNYTEFSGCAKAASSIRKVLFPVLHLADYNFTPVLNALSKTIQRLDKVNKKGQRAVNFSQHRYFLEGFSFNKQHPFDSVVRHPLHCTIDRTSGSAVVQLPALHPGANLLIPWQYPFFRFTIALGAIADRAYNGTNYNDPDSMQYPYALPAYTPWQLVQQPFAGQRFELQLNNPAALDDTNTLLLAVGIEIGMPVAGNDIDPVKYTGCAKIVAVG